MSDDPYAPQPIRAWFMPAAVASLLFMALGCVMYLLHLLADPAAMPLEQRTAYEATPAWVIGAWGVAVWVGAAGTVLLVLRRKLAEPLLMVSVAGVFVWLAGLLLVAGIRENMSANDLLVALAIAALTWTIFWFARHSRQRGWLR